MADIITYLQLNYMTYMPTEDELRREIEQQKRFFLEHHQEK